MISVAQYWEKRKEKITIIVAKENLPCPLCSGEMRTRSTCRRKYITSTGEIGHLQLRVRQCRTCRKTHRELPGCLAPYKRYNVEAIVEIYNRPQTVSCTDRTIWIIRLWLEWFLAYAEHIRESQQQILAMPLPKWSGEICASEIQRFVRLVANTGNWAHNRSGLPFT
jgi:hypothetical protein